mgnify:CR=1 FL=1
MQSHTGATHDGGRGAPIPIRPIPLPHSHPPRRGRWRPIPLAQAIQGAKRGVLDGRIVIVGQGELDKAEKVLEDLGVALDGGLPVLVDSTF